MTEYNELSTDFLKVLLKAIPGLSSDEGISEYDLITKLKDQGYLGFLQNKPYTTDELFQAHFLVYHALYKLRDSLLASGEAILQIEALDIRLRPYQADKESLAEYDKLREYYLDLSNLENITTGEINELIASFWKKLHNNDKRDSALNVLGLSDPVDDKIIKQTYRKLMMNHHPDRGGDAEQVLLLNEAIEILLG